MWGFVLRVWFSLDLTWVLLAAERGGPVRHLSRRHESRRDLRPRVQTQLPLRGEPQYQQLEPPVLPVCGVNERFWFWSCAVHQVLAEWEQHLSHLQKTHPAARGLPHLDTQRFPRPAQPEAPSPLTSDPLAANVNDFISEVSKRSRCFRFLSLKFFFFVLKCWFYFFPSLK